MVDPDDDNDGLLDTCIQIDTNNDQTADYTGLQNGGVTTFNLDDGGASYADATNVATSSSTSAGTGLTLDITTTAGVVSSVAINRPGAGYVVGDVLTINGGNSAAEVSVSGVSIVNFEIPGADGDADGTVDCEIDYDSDLDDDLRRPFDQNYNGIYDWLDTDMGAQNRPTISETLPLEALTFRTILTTITSRTRTTRSRSILLLTSQHGTARHKPTRTQPIPTPAVKPAGPPSLNSTTGTATESAIGTTWMMTTTASSTYLTSTGIVILTTTTTFTKSMVDCTETTGPTMWTQTLTAMDWRTALIGTMTTTVCPIFTTPMTETAAWLITMQPMPLAHLTIP